VFVITQHINVTDQIDKSTECLPQIGILKRSWRLASQVTYVTVAVRLAWFKLVSNYKRYNFKKPSMLYFSTEEL
jgi:hypothetical protein